MRQDYKFRDQKILRAEKNYKYGKVKAVSLEKAILQENSLLKTTFSAVKKSRKLGNTILQKIKDNEKSRSTEL